MAKRSAEKFGTDPSDRAAHIPEDRIATGVSMKSTITENLVIGKERRPEFASRGIHLKKASITRYAEELFENSICAEAAH